MDRLQELLYMDEHRSCNNYHRNSHGTGFRLLSMKKGENFHLENLRLNYIFCFLQGACCLQSQAYSNRVFRGGEMILLPQTGFCRGRAEENTELIIFGFDVPLSSCDRALFEESLNTQHLAGSKPTPIKESLMTMLTLLSDYLRQGFSCGHLHDLKHQEFFLLIRKLYTKEQITQLFSPAQGKSLEFRSKILRNYNNTTTVADLIEISGLSRSGFFVRFKQEFGMTTKEWLANQIKQDIINLATNRELSVKEIMFSLNFDSLQQFNRFCKHNFGLPPVQFIGHIRERIAETQLSSQPVSHA